MLGAACVVCQQTKGITPAHLAPRTLGSCDHPDCVVPRVLCAVHRLGEPDAVRRSVEIKSRCAHQQLEHPVAELQAVADALGAASAGEPELDPDEAACPHLQDIGVCKSATGRHMDAGPA
jgi:hypothetical protein